MLALFFQVTLCLLFLNVNFITDLILIFTWDASGFFCSDLSILVPEPAILIIVAYEHIFNIVEGKPPLVMILV